jgi:hypothetical protein
VIEVFQQALMPGSARGPAATYYPYAVAPFFDAALQPLLGIAVKATCVLSTGVTLPRADQEEVQLVDTLSPQGLLQLPADLALRRTGTSIAFVGEIAARSDIVELSVGQVARAYRVSPPLRWARQGATSTKLPTGEPWPSRELAWTSFYGGTDGAETWEANPLGIGFVRESGEADGQALPLLTEIGAEVSNPADRPPATLPCFLPSHWADRRAFFPFDETRRRDALSWPRDLDERFFDVVPQCWVHRPFLRGGEPIEIAGLARHPALGGDDGVWHGFVPRRAFRLLFRGKTLPLPLTLLRLEPAQDRAVLTFSTTLAYPLGTPKPPHVQIVEKRIAERAPALGGAG